METLNKPLVSIVIPVFNGAKYLREAIDSALAQTYDNIEVLVVNDGSDDDGHTEVIARAYGERIRYFTKPNGGVASALNHALHQVSGEYWSWLSHDDLYAPEKIEIQVRHLASNGEAHVVLYSDFSIFSDDSGATRTIRMKSVPPEHFRYFITTGSWLHSCTLLIPRTATAECGEFDESLRTTQDYDLWFRMAHRYRFVHIPSVLVHSRRHAGQGSVRLRHLVQREGNALFGSFVDALEATELTGATGKSVVRSLASLAVNLSVRGFRNAAWHAARLTFREIGRSSHGDDMRALGTLAGALVFGVPFGALRQTCNRMRVI
jgi:glycosyltransferase involved in cell wall biosynthesis